MSTEKSNTENWNKADANGVISVPDYLDPLINKIGIQFRFHTISGISEAQAVCNSVYAAEKFFNTLPADMFKNHTPIPTWLIIDDLPSDNDYEEHYAVFDGKDIIYGCSFEYEAEGIGEEQIINGIFYKGENNPIENITHYCILDLSKPNKI